MASIRFASNTNETNEPSAEAGSSSSRNENNNPIVETGNSSDQNGRNASVRARRRDDVIVNCSVCGTRHRKTFWYRHILSQVHKNAVIRNSASTSSQNRGIILHQTSGMLVYDILFTVGSANYADFSLPEITSVDEASNDDTFQACKITIESFFTYIREGVLYRLEEALLLHNSIKVHCSLSLNMQKYSIDGQILSENVSLRTTAEEILISTDLMGWFTILVVEMLVKYEECSHRGSNWTLRKVNDFELHISKFNPLNASSFVPLPIEIIKKKAIINVENVDEYCFKYAILSKVLHEKRPRLTNLNRTYHYNKPEYQNLFNFSNIQFPTPISDVRIFERDNGVSVNIYGLSKEKENRERSSNNREWFVYPLYISKNYIRENHFNLLYIQEESTLTNFNVPANGHYCYIANLSRLVSAQNNQHDHRLHICHRCLQGFSSENKLITHETFCGKHEPIRSEMPTEQNNIQEFKNFKFQQRVPYIIYADFECALAPFSTVSRELNVEGAFTEKTHIHLPTSYCYYIVCSNEADNTDYSPQLYRGANAVQHFWNSVSTDLRKISDIYENIIPINLTVDDEPLLRTQAQCHICGEVIIRDSNDLPVDRKFVVDHCHLTGKVRGWACNACNINYKLPNFVPIVLHNGSNYDFKMLIRDIYSNINDDNASNTNNNRRKRRQPASRGRRVRRQPRSDFILDQAEASEADDDDDESDTDLLDNDLDEDLPESESNNERSGTRLGEIAIIAKNVENFISFQVKVTHTLNTRFIDSFRFMSSSLSSLVNNLNVTQLKHTRKFFPNNELFELVKRKGVFPYEYIAGFEQYSDHQLPPIESFYSSLTGESISMDDYRHAQAVYDTFECQTLGEYSDIYLKTDVLLLADVFESFRDLCLEIYRLDAAWHYSAPGLVWNAMLKVTQVKLELLTDNTMFLFYEASIRGGYCAASIRHVKANNPSLNDYNPDEPSNYLLYIDANNLYGWAMSQPLPLRNFKWLEQNEIDSMDIQSIADDGPIGYVLEVDLEYPRELHNLHNDLPFCAEQLKTTASKSVPHKLIATLHDKNNYIIHYRYLKLALSQGLRLKKIHRGVKFHQGCWMQPYITLNNDRRKIATTDFAKDYHKLMNNACFGKFLESIRKRRSSVLTNNPTSILKHVRKPTFKRRLIINEATNLVIIERAKTNVLFDKFIQAGGAILDLSKTLMYDFHYNTMKNTIFPNSSMSLAYTDTDNFIYDIRVDFPLTLTDYLLPYKTHFDFSDYPPNHPLHDVSNKKVLGKMKDEVAGKQISEFCALKAKMYSFKVDEREVKKAKGIAKSVIRRTLNFEHYLNCLTNTNRTYRTVTSIRSFSQQLYTIQQNKVALSMLDDKRFILPDGIHTLAWGHMDIPAQDDIIRQFNFTTRDVEDDDDDINDNVEGVLE